MMGAKGPYKQRVAALGPFKYFPMDEASGAAVVEAGGSGNGTYYNVGSGTLLQADTLTDHPCPKFVPSSNGYANLGFNTHFSASFGLSLCLKVNIAACEVGDHIISTNQYYAGATNRFPFKIWYNKTTSKLESALSKGTDFNTLDVIQLNIDDLTTYHIVINYVNSTYHEMYVNGVLHQQNALTWALPNSGYAWLVAHAHEYGGGVGKSGFAGSISDVVFRAAPFTLAEIATLVP
jgi:hypothetical protein